MAPSSEDKSKDVFIELLAAYTNGTGYNDLSEKFPVISILGHKYVMVLYHYDSNRIIFRTIKNRSDI